MKLTIITPDKLAFEGEVTAVTVPGSAGSFQILKDHAAIVSTLDDGKVIIQNSQNADDQVIPIKGGVVEVKENNIIVLAEGIAEE
ncbi:MAG TPA: ATP synthase F1 subunit epsilon [Candidatus Sphingobacterium stercorigallinarum]|nr:ATP synthase F1 subunit epsilon [Candidatus Sphingobacterium stercorigallinarum]